MKIQLKSVALALLVGLSGCSQQNEVEQAKKRISELETELANLKSKETRPPTSSPPNQKTKSQARAVGNSSTAPTGEQWSYRSSEERMTGGTTHFATVTSTNSFSFKSPYGGQQNGHLTLRTDKKNGKDVMFSIERGQILCRSYENCEVLVRFDEDKPESFAGIGPADSSTETVFIRNYEKFLGKLRKSKTVRISLNIYQEGSPVFEFDTSGFSSEKYLSKK